MVCIIVCYNSDSLPLTKSELRQTSPKSWTKFALSEVWGTWLTSRGGLKRCTSGRSTSLDSANVPKKTAALLKQEFVQTLNIWYHMIIWAFKTASVYFCFKNCYEDLQVQDVDEKQAHSEKRVVILFVSRSKKWMDKACFCLVVLKMFELISFRSSSLPDGFFCWNVRLKDTAVYVYKSS